MEGYPCSYDTEKIHGATFHYDKPGIDELSLNPPKNKKSRPPKNALKVKVLKEYAANLDRLHSFVWEMVNQDIGNPVELYGVKNCEEVMRLAITLFRMALENRSMYQSVEDSMRIRGDDDLLADLYKRAKHTLDKIKKKEFVEYDGDTGQDIAEYVKNLETAKWSDLTLKIMKNMLTINKSMYYVDLEKQSVIRWKEKYLEMSIKIERKACLCLDVILPKFDEKQYASMDEYAKTLK